MLRKMSVTAQQDIFHHVLFLTAVCKQHFTSQNKIRQIIASAADMHVVTWFQFECLHQKSNSVTRASERLDNLLGSGWVKLHLKVTNAVNRLYQSSSSVSVRVGRAGLRGIGGVLEDKVLPLFPMILLGDPGGVWTWKASSHCPSKDNSGVSNSMTFPESHFPAMMKRPRHSPGMIRQWRRFKYTGLLVKRASRVITAK